MQSRLVGVFLLSSIVLAGCGSSGTAAAPTTTTPTTASTIPTPTTTAATTTSQTTSASTTSAATATAATAIPLGADYTATDSYGVKARVTVFSVDQNAAAKVPKPQSGGHWVSVDAQYCLVTNTSGKNIGLTWAPWTLRDQANGRYPASGTTYGGMPTPQYPNDESQIAVGECVRGSIIFPVPDGTKAAIVRYGPSGAQPAQWKTTPE